MLPTPNLDDQSFAQIMEEAVKSIPYVYPEWTDHNAHDPGITMLELFAWYKEMQQYQLNCASERTMDMYLKLLGMRRGEIRAARALLTFEGAQKPLAIAAGDEFALPGGMTYTFSGDASVGAARVCALVMRSGDACTDVTELVLKDHLKMRVFDGEQSELLIGIKRVQEEPTLRLLFEVAQEYPVMRNPFAPGQQPGRRLEWLDAQGNALRVQRDETYALSKTGCVELAAAGLEQSDEAGLGEMLWLRVRLEEAGCEEEVRLTDVSTSFALAEQKKILVSHEDFTAQGRKLEILRRTLLQRQGKCLLLARDEKGWRLLNAVQEKADRFAAEIDFELCADGKPNVRAIFYEEWMAPYLTADGSGASGFVWPLSLNDQLPDVSGLRLMGLGGGQPDRYTEIKCVPTLNDQTPFDRCCAFDVEKGALVFGDNLRGEVAPAGKDSLILMDFAVTMGQAGRFPAKQTVLWEEQELKVRAAEFTPGTARESTAAVKARLMRRLSEPSRVVTEEDFVVAAKRTPGLRVMQAGAIAGYDPERTTEVKNCTTVVVLPYSAADVPLPDARFLSAVREQMESVRPICMQVKVVPPLLLPVDLRLTVRTNAGAQAEEAIREALRAYFRADEEHWLLGAKLTPGEIAAVAGQVSGVLAVTDVRLTCPSARAGRSAAGELLLPPHALPKLNQVEIYQ